MEVTIENLNSVKKLLHIEIPENEVARELDKAYRDIGKKAKLKGFRPGKAPRSVLERYFKKEVHADVSSKLIQASFVDVMSRSDLKIIGAPQIDPPNLEDKGPFRYDATVEVHPEIEDIDFKGLNLYKTRYRINDEDIDARLKMQQKNMVQLRTVEEIRPVEEGDYVLIDYEAFKDDLSFPEAGGAENHTIKVGAGSIHKTFDQKIVGMKPGDSQEITVNFPEDHFKKEVAGLDIAYRVTLRDIREEVLPPIDDEFAKDLGEYQTLDELKADIRKNLMQSAERRVAEELKKQIFDALIAKKDFEVPGALVEYELERIISETERSLAQRNISIADMGLTKENLIEQYREPATRQVKQGLIVNKLIEQEKLSVLDDEIDQGLREISEAAKRPLDEISRIYKDDQNRFELYKQSLLEKKAIKLIIDHSHITEREPEEKPKTETPTVET